MRRAPTRPPGWKYPERKTKPPLLRFFEKVLIDPVNQCWLWLGATNPGGYGDLFPGRGRRRQSAHRFSYETFIGNVPTGLDLDHLCRVRSCVNPWHLEPTTRKENLRRGKGGAPGAQIRAEQQLRRTHCKRGHEYNELNTRTSRGHRECRICHNILLRKYRNAQKQ